MGVVPRLLLMFSGLGRSNSLRSPPEGDFDALDEKIFGLSPVISNQISSASMHFFALS
jgi:hypothetical protein